MFLIFCLKYYLVALNFDNSVVSGEVPAFVKTSVGKGEWLFNLFLLLNYIKISFTRRGG